MQEDARTCAYHGHTMITSGSIDILVVVLSVVQLKELGIRARIKHALRGIGLSTWTTLPDCQAAVPGY